MGKKKIILNIEYDRSSSILSTIVCFIIFFSGTSLVARFQFLTALIIELAVGIPIILVCLYGDKVTISDGFLNYYRFNRLLFWRKPKKSISLTDIQQLEIVEEKYNVLHIVARGSKDWIKIKTLRNTLSAELELEKISKILDHQENLHRAVVIT